MGIFSAIDTPRFGGVFFWRASGCYVGDTGRLNNIE